MIVVLFSTYLCSLLQIRSPFLILLVDGVGVEDTYRAESAWKRICIPCIASLFLPFVLSLLFRFWFLCFIG